MAAFQKFQFDNFIIDEDNHLHLQPGPEEMPPAEPETVAVEKVIEEPEVIREIPVEEVITYSEEEVAAKEKQAEERGYEKGFKTAQEGLEAQNNRLLEEINNRLLMLAANIDDKEKQLENQALELAREVVVKLVPSIEKENAAALVAEFLSKNFKNFKNEAKLSFYFNPDIIKPMQETIARLANINDFEGKISLHKDTSLSVSDCRIEWENGGVERSGEQALKKVGEIFEANMYNLDDKQ